MSAAGVIPDHSAQRAPAMRRGIGAKRQMVKLGALAQAVQNQPGLNPRHSGVLIDLQNSVHVFGEIHYHSDVAALSGQARAASSRQNGRAICLACGYRGDHVVAVARNHQPNGNLAIVGGIRGVKRTTTAVEAYFSVDRSVEFLFQFRCRGKRIHRLGMGTEWERRKLCQGTVRGRGHRVHAETAGCTVGVALARGSEGISSIFIQSATIAPNKRNAIVPRKGNSQLPVRSMIMPAKTGEMIAASADPEFIKPLAKPENFGAISMGIAHIGATVNSAKKKARLRKMTAEVKL